MALVAPSPETAVILPVTDALETAELGPCCRRASAGYAAGNDATEIAQHATNKTLRAIFIVVAANPQISKLKYATETKTHPSTFDSTPDALP